MLDELYIKFPRIGINIVQISVKSSVNLAICVNNQVGKSNTSFRICIDIEVSPKFPLCRAGEIDFKVGEGHGTMKSIVGHDGWPTRKIFEF